MAGALALLGVDRALLVERARTASTRSRRARRRSVVEVNGEELRSYVLTPEEAGVDARARERLPRAGGTPAGERGGHRSDPAATAPAAPRAGRGARADQRRRRDLRRGRAPTRSPRACRRAREALADGRAAERARALRAREPQARAGARPPSMSTRAPTACSSGSSPQTREELERRKRERAAAELARPRRGRAAARRASRDALRGRGIGVIAEFKRRSPSAGELRGGAGPASRCSAPTSAAARSRSRS